MLLPDSLRAGLWAHARRDAPRECVGALGGLTVPPAAGALGGLTVPPAAGALPTWQVRTLYPLPNTARDPQREYLADPLHLLRALKAMRAEGLELVGLYHSHPRGPDRPSPTDTRLATYDVPYLIADLSGGTLRAYLLPAGQEVPVLAALAPEQRM
ncbi:M67 family metallopeptidase [Deinococcus seoulensis]|uniref:M67 family metallopeptidase n=1 Tax=Deinococcus seoulensis TaxID=1837379 RepID=UPI001662ADB0|nr:M67 family metallopeptidase [Deinococcus seoulensis]